MDLTSDYRRVAIYARVSSDGQREADTIASQVAALRQRVAADGYHLDEALCFSDDGRTGETLLRPGLERLRDAVAAGAVDRLYIYEPDRLMRKYAYQVLLTEEFHRRGVEVIFLKRALGQSPEDELLLQVQGMLAEYERAKINDRCRRGKLYAARAGAVCVLGHAPYGYRYIRKADGGGQAREDVVEEEARVVRQLFDWVGRERVSLQEVGRRLTAQGVPTPRGRGSWQRSALGQLLTNSAYQGQALYGKTRRGERRPRLRPARGQPEYPAAGFSVYRTPAEERLPIAVPALVSADLFAAVQEQLAENRRRRREPARRARFLLQGLLVCQHCGYALCGRAGGPPAARRRRKYSYYRCVATRRAGAGGPPRCANRGVRVETLDAAIWEDVCALLRDPHQVEAEYRRRLEGAPSETDRVAAEGLDKRLRQVELGIARLIDAYAGGFVEKDEFEPRVRAARQRLAQLQAEAQQRAEQQTEAEGLRLVIGCLQAFAERVESGLTEADWASRREIIRALVKRVEIGKDEVRVVYRVNTLPFVSGPERAVLQNCPRSAGISRCPPDLFRCPPDLFPLISLDVPRISLCPPDLSLSPDLSHNVPLISPP